MFFKDDAGRYYPISSIACISPERTTKAQTYDRRFHQVSLTNETSTEISFVEFERIMREGAPMFAALSDTYVVHYLEDEDIIHKASVIAWGHSPEEGLMPITATGPNDGVSNKAYVLLPNGRVVAYEEEWESVDSFIEDQRSKVRT